MPDLVQAMELAPKEALAFWQQKVPLRAEEYYQLSDIAKANAFTVSGLLALEEVKEVQAQVKQALQEGQSLATFQRQMKGLPQGRVETIYRNNLQTAYMAGRYEQMKAVAPARPYWQYEALQDGRTRRLHAGLHGKVFAHDHPFWEVWYPPNGHRCRCSVRSLSAAQVQARGLKVEHAIPKVVQLPEGQSQPLVAEAGWGGNAGKEAGTYLQRLERQQLEGCELALAGAYLAQKNRLDSTFPAFTQGKLPGARPVAVLDAALRKVLGVSTQLVLLSKEDAAKEAKKHPEIKTEDYFERLQTILNQGEIIRQGEVHLVFVRRNGKWYQAVVKATQDGKELYLNSYHRAEKRHRNAARKRGDLIRKVKREAM